MGAEKMYYIMPDGTIKQINPFTGTEVWTVPSRARLSIPEENAVIAEPLTVHTPEDYCAFCEARMIETPPEKERLVVEEGQYKVISHVHVEKLNSTKPLFRRVSNLFEIVTMDYWGKNYGFTITGKNKEWRDEYMSNPAGSTHVFDMINKKLSALGMNQKDIAKVDEKEKINMANAFFAGGHELIIPSRHYKKDAKNVSNLHSSGDMTPEEHYQYLKFTIRSMRDIYEKNRYMRYISVYQNWLKSAGATFNHLHKQLVGIDEWGLSVEKEVKLLQQDSNIYNEKIVNFACYHNFVVAENDYAIAFADIGHRYPTLSVYSKNKNAHPFDHTDEELRGFSDLVHACHKAGGNQMSCNEEWYYAPSDALAVMPWHILIKWRIYMHAGFEGGTRIYINPVSPQYMRDLIAAKLFDLQDKKVVGSFKIGDECPAKPNCLLYNRR